MSYSWKGGGGGGGGFAPPPPGGFSKNVFSKGRVKPGFLWLLVLSNVTSILDIYIDLY